MLKCSNVQMFKCLNVQIIKCLNKKFFNKLKSDFKVMHYFITETDNCLFDSQIKIYIIQCVQLTQRVHTEWSLPVVFKHRDNLVVHDNLKTYIKYNECFVQTQKVCLSFVYSTLSDIIRLDFIKCKSYRWRSKTIDS